MANKIILGTAQFGLDYGINNSSGKPSAADINSILDYAYQNNIRLLDTAEAYGNSQELIGEYHSQATHKFDIITKFSSTKKDLLGSFTAQVLNDLQVLKVDSLYCYMFHSFRDFENYYKLYSSEITEFKKNGIIKKFGVSVYSNKELEGLLNYDEIELVQFPFNLLDNLSQRATLIAKLKAKGIEIHTRSVFLQGLMFKDLKLLPEKLSPLEPYLSQINSIAKQSNMSVFDLALNYVAQQNEIDFVLIGVDSLTQLKTNLASLNKNIKNETMELVSSILVKEVELLNPSNWHA